MDDNCNILLIEGPNSVEDLATQLQPTLQKYITAGVKHQKDDPKDWLPPLLQEDLPDASPSELSEWVNEIVESLNATEECHKDLENSASAGRSKESWFASFIKQTFSHSTTYLSASYLTGLDEALKEANAALRDTITNIDGTINKNPCLDGFLAEEMHAQQFNLNAKISGSPYHAVVLKPQNGTYGKNSVDIEIRDQFNKCRSKYQSKYCQNADATIKAFETGDYRGQQKLVPEDQLSDITAKGIKATDHITAPDGTTSIPKSKADMKTLQDEAQSGNWKDLNWNEYAMKDLAKGIAKQAGIAALIGAAFNTGIDIAIKAVNKEEIHASDELLVALEGGADFGIKAALAAALKVAVEKGIIKFIEKGTPSAVFSTIAFVAVENIKTYIKVAKGELSPIDGIEKIERTTISAVGGFVAMEHGTMAGAAVGGAILGVPGAAIGTVIGAIIGGMVGTGITDLCVRGQQLIRREAIKFVKKTVTNLAETADDLVNRVRRKFVTFAF